MKDLIVYIYEEEVKSSGMLYKIVDDSIFIECKYCTIEVNINDINYTTKSGSEILSGQELAELLQKIDSKDVNFSYIKSVLMDKKDDFKDIYNGQKENPLCYILNIKNAKIWPPKAEEIKKYKIEIYQLFNLEIEIKYGVTLPSISFGDMVLSVAEKDHNIKTGKYINAYIKIQQFLPVILFNIGKDLTGTEDEIGFKKLKSIISKNFKEQINKKK